MEFRDLKAQYRALQGQIDAAMQGVAASGGYILGKSVAALEERLAAYAGTKHCISCANGTDALTLALKCWDIGPGDAVFVPDFTFFASAETIAAEGATPVFVDVCKKHFWMQPKDLEAAIQETMAAGKLKPKAIITVDLFGLPANYPKILPIAQKYGLKVLEDGAQGFGGSIEGKRACSFGDISTTSFFPAKPLGCYGDGGALFTDNDEWAALARSLRVHGKGSDKYDNVRIGLNSRLDALQAAILQVKLDAFEQYELDAVNLAAQRYDSQLEGFVQIPHIPEGFVSSRAQYTIVLRDKSQRDAVQSALKAEGIPSMVYYPVPMSAQTAFSGLENRSCPNAKNLSETVLSLPMHPYLGKEDSERVCSAVIKAIQG